MSDHRMPGGYRKNSKRILTLTCHERNCFLETTQMPRHALGEVVIIVPKLNDSTMRSNLCERKIEDVRVI